jgi:hypothetical protein
MSKKSKIVSKLKRALETPSVYRITRRSKAMDKVDGFVVGLSTQWVLIARTFDGGYPDGLMTIRVRDITRIDKDTSFETRFALSQPQRDVEALASINLESAETILATMWKLNEIVSIEREKVAPGKMAIGRYEGKHRKHFGLWLIFPDGSWDTGTTAYRFKQVTNVSIDNHYLTALASVAGQGPVEAK